MTMPDMTEHDAYEERIRKPLITIPKSFIGKVFFGIGIFFWFCLLMLPCFCFALAINSEIRIPNGNIPEPEQHPFLQISLIMEIQQRGLQISRSTIVNSTETTTCVETNINYLLWQTDESSDPATYCNCYERADANAEWQLTTNTLQACERN
jgi:hypothetical protein